MHGGAGLVRASLPCQLRREPIWLSARSKEKACLRTKLLVLLVFWSSKAAMLPLALVGIPNTPEAGTETKGAGGEVMLRAASR